jgi:hypothetical protein
LNSLDNKSKLILHLPTPKRAIERSYGTTVKDVKDIPIIKEFLDVFPDDLPGLPHDRAVEFLIELKPITALVSRRAYRMPPKELAKLKVSVTCFG